MPSIGRICHVVNTQKVNLNSFKIVEDIILKFIEILFGGENELYSFKGEDYDRKEMLVDRLRHLWRVKANRNNRRK